MTDSLQPSRRPSRPADRPPSRPPSRPRSVEGSRRLARLGLLSCVFLLRAPAAGAAPAEAGRFAVVQNQVASLKPGAAGPVAAILGGSVVIDERETTGPGSAAKLTFGEGAMISVGQKTTFTVTREVVDQVTGRKSSGVDLAVGKMRVFVSRFLSSGKDVRVNAPSAVVGIKGSEVIVEALDDGTTVVTVLSGSALVTALDPAGGERQLGPRETLSVKRGRPLGLPSPIDPGAIDDLRLDTDPAPPVDPRRETGPRPPFTPPPLIPPLGPPECVDCRGMPIDPEVQPECDCP